MEEVIDLGILFFQEFFIPGCKNSIYIFILSNEFVKLDKFDVVSIENTPSFFVVVSVLEYFCEFFLGVLVIRSDNGVYLIGINFRAH